MKKSPPTFEIEQAFWQAGCAHVMGVDEAGRGPLAGPLVMAGVIFPSDHQRDPSIHDSKLLSSHTRSQLVQFIQKESLYYSVKFGSVEQINQLGIAIVWHQLLSDLLFESEKIHAAIIDGKWLPKRDTEIPTIALVKGDQLSYSVAAASILAKVARDEYMEKLDQQFPQYGWSKNKGYGTLAHRQSIQQCGACPHHRNLFISKIVTEIPC